jgi:hypothetical protein
MPQSKRFAGRLVKAGATNADVVVTIQRRLNEAGCGPIDEDGVFGPQTTDAVRLFQMRFSDVDGAPLRIDGLVGAITWSALFGDKAVPPKRSTSDELLGAVLDFAGSQVGVMETPPGSNRGREVDRYVRAVGLDPGGRFAWCAAFIYFCFNEAAKTIGRSNPVVKTGGVLEHWARAGEKGVPRLTAAKVHLNEALVRPGHIFIIDTGVPGGSGHTGLVDEVVAGKLVTIEGNTNDGGSREGVGVFRRTGRRIRDVNVGFLDYAGR